MTDGDRPIQLLVYSDAVETGGAEQSLGTLLSALSARVHATVLGVDEDVARWIAGKRPDTPFEVVPPIRGKFDLKAIGAHVRAVRRLDPDIVHANLRWLWSGQFGMAAGLLRRGVSVIAVEHAAPVPSPHRIQRLIKRRLSLALDAHVSVGFKSARLVERYVGLPEGSVLTIHNGVPDDGNRSATAADVPAGPVIGAVGRITPEKGFADLLDALVALPDAALVIVGEGPERPALERRARELGVRDRLVVTGWTADPGCWVRGFDVFALPSRLEAFPLTVIEAMLAEVPVVASDVGSVSEAVIDGETGILVPAGDRAALTRAIAGLLVDGDRRERLSREARRLAVASFTAEQMADRFEALYDEILA